VHWNTANASQAKDDYGNKDGLKSCQRGGGNRLKEKRQKKDLSK